MLAWLCDWVKVQICIWPSWCHCSSLSLAPVYPDWFCFPGGTFLVSAHLDSPGQNPRGPKMDVRMCVCVCVCVIKVLCHHKWIYNYSKFTAQVVACCITTFLKLVNWKVIWNCYIIVLFKFCVFCLQALLDLQMNSDLKAQLHDLTFTGAKVCRWLVIFLFWLIDSEHMQNTWIFAKWKCDVESMV